MFLDSLWDNESNITILKVRYQYISITNQTSRCVTAWSFIGLYSCTDQQLEYNGEYFDETSQPYMF